MNGILRKIKSFLKKEEPKLVNRVLEGNLYEEALARAQRRLEEVRKEKEKYIRLNKEMDRILQKHANGEPLTDEECKTMGVIRIDGETNSYREFDP